MYHDFYWLLVAIVFGVWSVRYAVSEMTSSVAANAALLFGITSAVFLLLSLGFHTFA